MIKVTLSYARKPSVQLFLAPERWIDTLLNMRDAGLLSKVTEVWAFAIDCDCIMVSDIRCRRWFEIS